MSLEQENAFLRREVAQLREELETLRKPKSKKLGCLIAAAVCMGAMVIVLPIMAAIALPMYSTFKQKGRVATSLNAVTSQQAHLTAYYDSVGQFDDLVLEADGMVSNGFEPVAMLPAIPGVTWRVAGRDNLVEISTRWAPESGCPEAVCNGIWTLTCDTGGCRPSYRTASGDDPLGLDF